MSSYKKMLQKVQHWAIDAFPTPGYMMMPAVALDMSPNSVKYLSGKYTATGCLPTVFKEVFLPEGTIVDGIVKDEAALQDALHELRQASSTKFAFVAIPERALYLYTLQLSGQPKHSSIMQQIEFSFHKHVPIPLEDAFYDFDIVGITRASTVISVTVAPKELIGGYERALAAAGFYVRGIELEAYAVARSLGTRAGAAGVEMIVDVGYSRAGIIITQNATPIFSVTVSGGSKTIDTVIDECKKQYTFWDTRTNTKGKRIGRVVKVTTTGGSGNLLVKPLAQALGREVVLANVWRHLFDINDYIPSMDAREAQAMTTLAGLLLKNKM